MAHAANGIGLLFATLGAIGFSFKAILVKLAYQYGVDAETLLALRMGLSLPFFIAMGVVADRRAKHRLGAGDWVWMVGLGFSGYYLASYLDFLGLRYITAALERLILFLYPTIVILLSALFLAKPIGRRTVMALALCYGGIGLAVGHDLRVAGEARDVLLGCALVFGSALSYALYLMGNGEVVGRLGAMRVTAFATTVACVLCIAQFLVLRPVTALALPWQVYALGFAMAVFSTVAPVWLVSEAIRRLGAGPVSLTGTLGPVVTIFLGWLLLDEAVGAGQLAGAALVIAGVLVMARRA
jgi:drug/metabolite transporter (DMT)-like permease